MVAHQTLNMITPSDLEIVMSRVFDAPRRTVFDAFTLPRLAHAWLCGSPGWSMPVCEIEHRVGGRMRFVWQSGAEDQTLTMTGSVLEFIPPERFIYTQRFGDDWFPGEAVIRNTFRESKGRTLVATVMTFETRRARNIVLEDGVEQSTALAYNRLDDMLADLVGMADA